MLLAPGDHVANSQFYDSDRHFMGALRAGFPFRNQGPPAGVGIFVAVTLFIDRLLLTSRLDLIALATVGLLLIYSPSE